MNTEDPTLDRAEPPVALSEDVLARIELRQQTELREENFIAAQRLRATSARTPAFSSSARWFRRSIRASPSANARTSGPGPNRELSTAGV